MEMRQPISEQLERARRILETVAADPELQSRLATIGYDEEALRAGRLLYNAARSSRREAREERAEQKTIVEDLEAQQKRVMDAYFALADVALTTFADDPVALRALALHPDQKTTPDLVWQMYGGEALKQETRENAWIDLLDRARTLYDVALRDEVIGAGLERAGYPRKRLMDERVGILELDQLEVDVDRSTAESATQNQIVQQELAHLNSWVRRFLIVTQGVLKHNPHWLEQMGLNEQPEGEER